MIGRDAVQLLVHLDQLHCVIAAHLLSAVSLGGLGGADHRHLGAARCCVATQLTCCKQGRIFILFVPGDAVRQSVRVRDVIEAPPQYALVALATAPQPEPDMRV